jgi:hypothetical protein
MIYTLTSTETLLHVVARPQQSHVGDGVVEGLLHLKLKKKLTSPIYVEQQAYVMAAATAAYVSLNKLDQHHRYRASVDLTPINTDEFNFNGGSSSSGLGYALAIFDGWWQKSLQKGSGFKYPVFATGEILKSGDLKPVGHFLDKVNSLCRHVDNNKDQINNFYLCYPKENHADITPEQQTKLEGLGGILIPANRMQGLLGELLGADYDGDPLGRWQPFKGLASFEYEDNFRFFGREREVERLYEDLEKNTGLLIVAGASGTGKSSLIKAGLIPLLERRREEFSWAYTTPNALLDNNSFIRFIVNELEKAWQLSKNGLSPDVLIKTLSSSVDDGVMLIKRYSNKDSSLLLLFDQYEEIFSRAEISGDDIANNAKLIYKLAHEIDQLDVVISLRNEYIAALLDTQGVQSPVISNVSSEITSDSWHDIVNKQASFSGIKFEKNVSGQSLDQIIIENAIKTPFALPMVEFLLEQLYLLALDEGSTPILLQFRHFEAMGGLSGAIAHRAEEVVCSSSSKDQLNKLFDAFIGLNSELVPYAKSVKFTKYKIEDDKFYTLIEDFINANLIVSVTGDKNKNIVKFAHDHLFIHWRELARWIEDHKEYLIWRNSIDAQFNRWLHAEVAHPKSLLIVNSRLLKEGIVYQKDRKINNEGLEQYLTESSRLKTKKRLVFVLVFLVMPVTVAGILYWDKTRIQSVYYASVGERWGVPFGVGQLSKDQVKRRSFSYRIDSQDGVVKRLVHQNSSGTHTKDTMHENMSSWEYTYFDSGRLATKTIKNDVGKVTKIISYKFSGNEALAELNKEFLRIDFNKITKSPGRSWAVTKDFNDNVLKSNSDISRLFIQYNVGGQIEKLWYQNPYGTKVSLNNSHYGIGFEYNNAGLIAKKTLLDINGKAYVGLDGFKQHQYFYDESGNIKKTKVFWESDFGTLEYKRDAFGNEAEEWRLSSSNKLVERDYVAAIYLKDFDDNGNLVRIMSLGPDREYKEDRLGVAIIERGYDIYGRMISEEYFNKEYNRHIFNDNYAKIKVEYDAAGNINRRSFFDKLGIPVLSKIGCAKVEQDFDEDFNEIERRCFDVNMKPKSDFEGCAKTSLTYNDKNFPIDIRCFDKNDAPALNADGFFNIALEYSISGNVVEERYLGVDGTPANGLPHSRFKYDDRGNVIEQTFFDKNDIPSAVEYGIYKLTWKYDKIGRLIEEGFRGRDGALYMHPEMNYAKKVSFYSLIGNVHEGIAYFNDKNEEVFP